MGTKQTKIEQESIIYDHTAMINHLFTRMLEQYQIRIILNLPEDADIKCAFLKAAIVACKQIIETRQTNELLIFDMNANLKSLEKMSADFCKARCNHTAAE